MQSSMSRITIGLALLVILSIVIMECSGNPSSETGDPNVANAIRYLQDLEKIARPRQYSEIDDDSPYNNHALILEMYLEKLDRKHARTPRFGKRGNANGYLNKEYVDFNMLRYLLQNPELLQRETES